jgi:broad specificity phosphatase PhoE
LTAAGAKRAQDLAAVLGNANLTAIITTQLRRARETAQPIAAELGLAAEPIELKQLRAGPKALYYISELPKPFHYVSYPCCPILDLPL